MRKKRNRSHSEKNIRFRERMLLIYIIGGIIPFLGISIYNSKLINEDMMDASKTTQQEVTAVLAADMKREFPVAERLAEKLCSDDELRRIVETKYEEDGQVQAGASKRQEIVRYQQEYAENISTIKIYVKNQAICYEEPFARLDAETEAEQWYVATIEAEQGTYWGYGEIEENGDSCIQYSRKLENADGDELGVVVIQMNSSVLKKNIEKTQTKTAVLWNDQMVLFSNFLSNQDYQFLFNRIQAVSDRSGTLRINERVDEYLVTYRRVSPEDSDTKFTVACFRDCQQIKTRLNRANLNTYIVMALSLLFSVLMIVGFSNSFGVRLQKLRRQMHLVANGRYEEVEPIEGNDEVAEIYHEVEKMMGDIQDLTSNMVEEKVQKEKLHTRQKEVEFKMLASQINPHFLYNTLETIRMKARVNGQDEIEDLVKMLAKIMRRNIQVSNQMVTLQSEVELTENYLKIQNYRFGDRIESSLTVDPEMDLEMEVMPLIIQPFVENAFVHGLESMPGQGRLTIEITQDTDDVIIRIADNGAGMPYYKLAELRHTLRTGENVDQTRIGVNNVNQRLKIQYGDEYGVQIDSREQEGTTIEIRFPRKCNFSGKNV